MWIYVKRGGGVSSIKPRNYTTALLGGREYLCAFSGSSVSSLYATWVVPAGGAAPCGHHLWGTEKKWQVREKANIYISGAGGDICCVFGGLGGGYECGNLMVLSVCGLLTICVFFPWCVFFVCFVRFSIVVRSVWHSVPSVVLVAFPFFTANQVIFHCTSVYYVCHQPTCYCSTCHCSTRYVSLLCMLCVQYYCLLRF